MKLIKKIILTLITVFILLIVALDIWGYMTLGQIEPATDQARNLNANQTVLVMGATGSAGDGLLKAAIEDPNVKKVYVITRRRSDRIDAGVASGKVEMIIHKDFSDYSSLSDILSQVNTVLWGLGTSSLQVDDATYSLIHVDFPLAFTKAWLSKKTAGPMSFHFITGMGTDGSAHWAQEKRRTERELAALAQTNDLRTFSYRSAFIRPSSERANFVHYILEALLIPGKLVISSRELGQAMLEISSRTLELPNGTLIDNADSIAYAKIYQVN